MGLNVAIVGLAPSTHDLAPWGDSDWEIWGLPWDDAGWAMMARHFEMHDLRLLESAHSRRKPGYFDRLKECPRLYMQEAYAGFPAAVAYPYEEVSKSICAPYWNSSIAYAMALAIHEGAEQIGIYGVDMALGEEYAYQKPNMEYLIGIARGKGIKVILPDSCPLTRFNPTGIAFYDHMPTYTKRYGWLG